MDFSPSAILLSCTYNEANSQSILLYPYHSLSPSPLLSLDKRNCLHFAPCRQRLAQTPESEETTPLLLTYEFQAVQVSLKTVSSISAVISLARSTSCSAKPSEVCHPM